ncbi:hypothetical protein FRC12_013043 [Ceratobasidium sp. 428]|nr:hypothetical protein FRC12_013043 [Ceratobasidium sp. 428]
MFPPLDDLPTSTSSGNLDTMTEKQDYISYQPTSHLHMSPTCPPPTSTSSCSKSRCHAQRPLRTLVPALIALLTIIALSAWLVCSNMMDMGDMAADMGTVLWKRQSAASGSNNDSPFVKNKRTFRSPLVHLDRLNR